MKEKIAKLKWVLIAFVLVIGAGGGAFYWTKIHPVGLGKAESVAQEKANGKANEKDITSVKKEVLAPDSESVFRSLSAIVTGVHIKIQSLKESEQDKEQLRLENANLRLQLQSVRQECIQDNVKKSTITLSDKVEEQTGSRVGRSLASINYKAPTHLLPSQLYSLGVTYFKSREDDKAAVIFTLLTGMEESDLYRNAKDLLMTGVAWYRIENFELADKYFESAIATKELPDNLPYQAQSRLWRGLVAQKLGKTAAAQQWLKELLDYHPHSIEAEWINQGDGEKAASKNAEGTVSEEEVRKPAAQQDRAEQGVDHGEHINNGTSTENNSEAAAPEQRGNAVSPEHAGDHAGSTVKTEHGVTQLNSQESKQVKKENVVEASSKTHGKESHHEATH